MEDVATVIFAGGASRRMGRDKALLRLPDGRTNLETILETARSVAPTVYLAVDTEAHAQALCSDLTPPHPEIVLDVAGRAGPLSALAAALQRTEAPALLALAVDAPLVPAALLRALTAVFFSSGQTPPAIVAPLVQGIAQPMPALYSSALRGAVLDLLRRGRGGPSLLLEDPDLAVQLLDVATLTDVLPEPRRLFGANSAEEWQALLALQQQGQQRRVDQR